MSTDDNSQTCEDMKLQIKSIQATCLEMSKLIQNNAPVELKELFLRSPSENSLNYMDALATNIEAKETEVLTCDENLLTAQFLHELKERTDQVKQLSVFIRSVSYDIDEEIIRLKSQLKIIKEAKQGLGQNNQKLKIENLQKARDKFYTLKGELQSLITTLFPRDAESMSDVLAHLLSASLEENNSGYIEITEQNSEVIEILADMGLVKRNPYNKEEVKLA